MGFYVLVQPDEKAAAMLVEHAEGHPSLIVQCGDSQIAVQIPGRSSGVQFAIKFGRELGNAAFDFAERCEALTQLQPPNMDQLRGAIDKLAEEPAGHGDSSGGARHTLRGE